VTAAPLAAPRAAAAPGARPRPAPAALILAGGDGLRLRALTREIAGDDRPKQFCALLGGETLWEQTRRRAALSVAPGRTVTVVTETHERFYTPLLGGEAARRVVVQPENRGTAPGVLYGLLRLARLGAGAPVVVLPSDHWVSDDRLFMAQVDRALEAARRHPRLVTLLGIAPDAPEAEYGWIEPQAPVEGELRRVGRFWEKPAPEIAAALGARGCLWNSFVMAGRVAAFLDLVAAALPWLREGFRRLAAAQGRLAEARVARELYAGLPLVDFSRQVLQARPERLAVLPVAGLGWNDLGDPARVRSTRGAVALAVAG
jgi:mannose-1-phosphate guanylyltransferase